MNISISNLDSVLPKYIKGFDGLRAISIFFVVFAHLTPGDIFINSPYLEKNYKLFSGER